jgi:hypothetical protein
MFVQDISKENVYTKGKHKISSYLNHAHAISANLASRDLLPKYS